MAQAIKDNNRVNTITGVLNTDGSTVTLVKANPTSHILMVHDNGSGTDYGSDDARFDNNNVSTLIAVSNADGITPVTLYIDSSGQLLIKST